MRKCPNCLRELSENELFCTYCGVAVSRDSVNGKEAGGSSQTSIKGQVQYPDHKIFKNAVAPLLFGLLLLCFALFHWNYTASVVRHTYTYISFTFPYGIIHMMDDIFGGFHIHHIDKRYFYLDALVFGSCFLFIGINRIFRNIKEKQCAVSETEKTINWFKAVGCILLGAVGTVLHCFRLCDMMDSMITDFPLPLVFVVSAIYVVVLFALIYLAKRFKLPILLGAAIGLCVSLASEAVIALLEIIPDPEKNSDKVFNGLINFGYLAGLGWIIAIGVLVYKGKKNKSHKLLGAATVVGALGAAALVVIGLLCLYH